MAWAVLAKNEPYRPPMLAAAATTWLACRWRLAEARLGNRIRDSHIYRPAAATEWRFSARSAGELWDDTTVEPGALETCKPEKPFKAA